MDRRNFMAAILAAATAPAIVKAGSIMRINPQIIAQARPALGAMYVSDWLTVENPAGWRVKMSSPPDELTFYQPKSGPYEFQVLAENVEDYMRLFLEEGIGKTGKILRFNSRP